MSKFTVKTGDQEVELVLRDPSLKDQQEGQKIYNTAFSEAVQSKALLRAKLDRFMRDQGMWDDDNEDKLRTLQKKLSEGELKLAKGGIKLSEAKQLALDMRSVRAEMRELLSTRISYDNNTADGQADNSRFNYLVSVCTVYADSQKPYFSDYNDFLNKNGVDPVASTAAQRLAEKMYGVDENFEQKLPENEFLFEFKFINKDLNLINKEGKLVDLEGRYINDLGQFVNENGEQVDINGNLLDEDGNIKVDRSPFLDDDGEPIQNVDEASNNTDGETDGKTDGEHSVVETSDNESETADSSQDSA